MSEPFLELYEKAFEVSKSLGYPVFDHLPDRAEYPFIFVGEQFSDEEATKQRDLGDSNLIIHVFHEHTERREVNKIVNDLLTALKGVRETGEYTWAVRKVKHQVYGDGTESNPLFHGYIDITYLMK